MRSSEQHVEPSTGPDHVVAWRIERLREAGCGVELADSLARDRGYDLHELLELIDGGCPAELAARILAPLEDDRRPC
jgi:hypothetical protein